MANGLLGTGIFLYEEKRSKFISRCEKITTEAEARAVIESVRAEHRTASHHVYAYGLRENNILRHSDDGEPQGTAGLPVLNIFIKKDIVDFVCVVTRYFGGTLLGAGGLVRAYGQAAKGALEAAGYEALIQSALHRVVCPYARLESMKYYFEKNGITLLHIDYREHCEASVKVPEPAAEAFAQGGSQGGYYTIKSVPEADIMQSNQG